MREIKAGNWVLWFKLDKPVRIASDRTGKRKTLDEIKLNLHGRTGSLEVYKPVGEDQLALRGRGPSDYQDMVRRTLTMPTGYSDSDCIIARQLVGQWIRLTSVSRVTSRRRV